MSCLKRYRQQATGGTLVKRDGRRVQGKFTKVAEPKPAPVAKPSPVADPSKPSKLSAEWYMENWGLNDWNTSGWHGGGQMPIRNLKQKTRPSRSRHHETRRAHPSLLKVRAG